MPLSPQLCEDLSARFQAFSKTALSNLSQFYAEGFWHSFGELAWWLELGPACLAATMARYGADQNAQYRAMAIESVDRAITYNLRPVQTTSTGVPYQIFAAGYEGLLDPSQDDTCTIECIASIGWIMQMLTDLDTPTWTKWMTALKNCVNWLDLVNGNTTYYINGNFAAHQCLAYYHVAALCRKGPPGGVGSESDYQTYIAKFENAYKMMVTPGIVKPTQFVGYGLVVDVTGVQPDWSDYTAYLTETNGYIGNNITGNHWDIYYSTLQLDILAELYLLKRDLRINQLLNALHNKMQPRINTTTWLIDMTGGSRKSFTGVYEDSWIQVIALVGPRNIGRSFFTDTVCKNSWDVTLAPNLLQGTNNTLIGGANQRSLQIAVSVIGHLVHAANKVLT